MGMVTYVVAALFACFTVFLNIWVWEDTLELEIYNIL
jgi:hypothetical protein